MKNKPEKIKIQEKKYYDVKVEVTLPATLTYRILAETPEQALDLIKNQSPVQVKHKLAGRKELKATVFDAGSSMIRFIKKII